MHLAAPQDHVGPLRADHSGVTETVTDPLALESYFPSIALTGALTGGSGKRHDS